MRKEMTKGWRGSWGREVRVGTHISEVFVCSESRFSWAVEHEFLSCLSPHLNFSHFTHSRQTASWCWNQCVRIALESQGRIQRVGVSEGEEREKGAKPTQSFHSVKLFVTSKHTHSQAEWKAQLTWRHVLARRLWILFLSQNVFCHWVGRVGGGLPSEEDDF